jgi:hypothetical protein
MPAGQNHTIAIVGLDVTALFTDIVLAEAARAAAAADAPSDDDRSN